MTSLFKKAFTARYNDIPLWITVPYTLLALVILPVYWWKYGPGNFLWFSDIAFFVMVPALWFKNRFASSMMAIGVLPLETLWMLSFATGGAFLGMANYMFDDTLPLWLRALSLFHFPMPAVIIYMICRFGYDPRALWPQIAVAISVLFLTRWLTDPSENVNMGYTPPDFLQGHFTPDSYMYAMMFTLVTCVIIPMHFILKKYAPMKPL